MDFYSQHKKKIRGWKRHKRKIERWKQNSIQLDMESLANNERDYVKLWIHPFYRLEKRNPPRWYCELLLEAMLDVYDSWKCGMESIKQPFYLKLWLYDPSFIKSQIVVAYKDCFDFYDNVFERNVLIKEFPFEKYPRLKERLKEYQWELHIDSLSYWESEWLEFIEDGEATEKELSDIREKANKIIETKTFEGKPDRIYKHYMGDIWVGSLKS